MKENATIHNLANFLKTHGEFVIDGSSKLCLSTSCISELSRQFAMLATDVPESESFNVLSCNAGSDVIRQLLFLHDILQKVVKLKLVTSARTVEGEIALSRFRSVRHLELHRVPTHLFTGMGAIASQLEMLGAHRCLSHVEPLLKLADGHPWTSLVTLQLSKNTLTSFESDQWQEAPNLKNLDLSHNLIERLSISGLEFLVCVDLSFNFISEIPSVHRRSSFLYLSHLSMRHNLLESLQGLEFLTALKVLDLGFNMISEFGVLEPLINLMQLDKLTLEGNPISFHQNYLSGVAAHIAKTIILDGKFDVHSNRAAMFNNDAGGSGSFRKRDTAFVLKSPTQAPKTRQLTIADPMAATMGYDSLVSGSLQAASLRNEVAMRKKDDPDLWLINATNEFALPNAQSTPFAQKSQPHFNPPMHKESHQSDDCVVVSEQVKSFDALTLTVEDVETQPRGALMTSSQTESAGDGLVDEEFGPLVMADESDKDESPAAIFDENETLAIIDPSTFLYASENEITLDESTVSKWESPTDSLAESESSSVVCRIEQDASVWIRLTDIRRDEVEYDNQHSIDTDSKMHLELVIFGRDEDFKAAFKVQIVLNQSSFGGFLVISSKRLYLTGFKVSHEGIRWKCSLNSVTRVTIQPGAQTLLLETKKDVETNWALVYVGDTNWCGQLAQNLSLYLPHAAMSRADANQTKLLGSLVVDENSLRSYAQGFWSLIDDTGSLPVSKRYLCVAVAAEELVVVRENHIDAEKVKFTEICVQSMAALSTFSVDESNPRIANLIFTDESTNQDQVWYFETVSAGSMLAFIDSLKQPWQDIFDVELPLTYIRTIESCT